ncbi:MAPEG family protein [Sulfitobacter sabulilitoris]|uniref:MAPEG family protein n=1 Tax=Sulfitobacter sabulilitoris TaxID=2562655 RepID=A0A5S3PL16_9RHOB|nr:MAPEG family protein [Sulfitobacter sabulilitoris]TMM54946.1 MAPEG family protein [Sulfitobacter sabulilitoris]
MEPFAEYGHAIASLALWALIVSVLSGLSTRGRTAEKRCDCGKPKRDYADQWYRSERAFMNAVETSGPFVAATLAAILAGASPTWVNLLASVFIVSRIAVAFVHIGTTIQSLRSAIWSVGMLCVLGLVVMAIAAVL